MSGFLGENERGWVQLGERQGKIEVELIRKGGKIREAKDNKRERGEANNEKRIIISWWTYQQ